MEYVKQRQLTQTKIKKSFINLLQTTQFDAITINNIVQKAEMSRSSFYRYYLDKYDLINEIEDDILKEIKFFKQNNENSSFNNLNINESKYIEELLLFMKQYSDEINGLLNNSNYPSFENKLKKKLISKLYNITKQSELSPNIDIKKRQEYQLIVEYMTNMIIQTFKFWSSPNCQMSAAELSNLLNNIKLNGFSKIINLLNSNL